LHANCDILALFPFDVGWRLELENSRKDCFQINDESAINRKTLIENRSEKELLRLLLTIICLF
jgi:hypothetical protein